MLLLVAVVVTAISFVIVAASSDGATNPAGEPSARVHKLPVPDHRLIDHTVPPQIEEIRMTERARIGRIF